VHTDYPRCFSPNAYSYRRIDCPFAVFSLLLDALQIYLEPEAGDAVIRWASSAFATSCFVTYEQIRPDDAFGATMIRNLEVLRQFSLSDSGTIERCRRK
jgi:hypothetical protein